MARWAVLVLLLHLALPSMTRAAYGAGPEGSAVTEHQLKAAFLYSFAKFVDWPDEGSKGGAGTFLLCIWGHEQYEATQLTLAGKSIRGQKLEVRPVRSAADAQGCQLLFISAAFEPSRSALEQISGAVLTIGESAEFLRGGGMINLVRADNRLRFEIARQTGERAGLKFSSQLLKLAAPAGEGR